MGVTGKFLLVFPGPQSGGSGEELPEKGHVLVSHGMGDLVEGVATGFQHGLGLVLGGAQTSGQVLELPALGALVLGFGYLAASIAFALREERKRARVLLVSSLAYLPLLVATYGLHFAAAAARGRGISREGLLRVEVAAPALVAATLLVVVFGGASDAFIYFRF